MTATLPAARTGRRGVVVLVLVVLLGVVAVLVIGRPDRGDDRPLSTTSTAANGARALARLLEARGTSVDEVGSLDDARGGGADRTVLLLDPTAYTPARLRAFAAEVDGPLVLLQPDDASLAAVGAVIETSTDTTGVDGTVAPRCDDPAASAAGPVDFVAATAYDSEVGATTCYSGAFARDGRVAVLGDPSALSNGRLADEGTAALALDVLGTTSQLAWVRPGADATAGPTGSVWTALPDHAETAALWLVGVGLLLVLWRGRRLATPVAEPLPVVVRADELVRGRARLHERAGATGRAAAVLRNATTVRVRRALVLPPDTPRAEVTRQAARHLGAALPPGLLDGPAPADGEALLRLARDLATLEEHVRRPARAGRAGWSA